MTHFKAPSRFAALSLAVLAVIACSGTGCRPSPKQAGPPEKITLAYTTNFTSALVHIALKKGFFADEGLDVSAQPHAFGKLALEAITLGKADLATLADTPVMFAVMGGKKITILAVISTSNRNEAILARQDRGIAKPSDLKGKNIGVTLGTTSDFFADSFLIAHGLDRKQVRIIALKPDEMSDALVKGKVDAVSTWNPNLQRLQKELGNNGRSFYGETLYTEFYCVAAGQDFVKQHPETIKKVLRAIIKAETLVREHPEETRRLVADFIKVDRALLDELWGIFNFRVTLDQALLVNLEEQTRWAIKHGLTARTDMPNYLDFIYVDGLRAVKPEAARIIR